VQPKLPANALFSSATFKKYDNYGQYTLTLKQGKKIEGYYIEKTANGIILHVKRPVTISAGDKPLTGITIMLDPGHGGSDTGAIGPLGTDYAEKRINLNTALKLQTELTRLGAKVIMTRTTDTAVSLSDRLTASRNAKPDLFISVHSNSMADNVDISKIKGFSVYYKEPHAESLAQSLLAGATKIGRANKGVRWANFYVVRGTWAPSVLIENGFVPNPDEFELLSDDSEQVRLAKSLADSIVKYFSK